VSRRAAVALVVAAVLVVGVVAIVASSSSGSSSGSGGPPGSAAATVPVVPLPSSVTVAARTSVVLPMGHLDDPANTFWQLFLRPTGGGAWRLETPPGVADNGGLVVSLPSAGPLTAGFLPSADLHFSPLAQTVDGGSTWTPGQLPTALVAVPDALATGAGGGLLALVAQAGQSVLASDGDPTAWRTEVSTAALARAVPACGVTRITAVAFDAADRPVVGVGCARAGVLGVLTAASPASVAPSGAGPWQLLEPATMAATATTTVLRLDTTSSGLQGLAELRSGSAASLEALWAQGVNGRWAVSPTLSLAGGWTVRATAVGGGAGAGAAVLLASGTARRIEEVGAPGAAWATLPDVPAGTGAIAAVGAETDAFVASGSQLTVWAWTPATGGWRRQASITVPIQYGSSS